MYKKITQSMLTVALLISGATAWCAAGEADEPTQYSFPAIASLQTKITPSDLIRAIEQNNQGEVHRIILAQADKLDGPEKLLDFLESPARYKGRRITFLELAKEKEHGEIYNNLSASIKHLRTISKPTHKTMPKPVIAPKPTRAPRAGATPAAAAPPRAPRPNKTLEQALTEGQVEAQTAPPKPTPPTREQIFGSTQSATRQSIPHRPVGAPGRCKPTRPVRPALEPECPEEQEAGSMCGVM